MGYTRSIVKAVRGYLNRPELATGETPFKIRPDDVFLCSYPRSGNVWVRYALMNCIFPDDALQLKDLNAVLPNVHDRLARVADLRSPRIIKTQFALRREYPKVIYLLRDGRDVCVSFYNYRKRLFGYGGSFDEFV